MRLMDAADVATGAYVAIRADAGMRLLEWKWLLERMRDAVTVADAATERMQQLERIGYWSRCDH